MSRRSLVQKIFPPIALWKSVRRIQNFSLTPEIQTSFFLLFATQFQHQSFVIAANKFQSCICIE